MHRYLFPFAYVYLCNAIKVLNYQCVKCSIIFCKKLPAHFFSVATQLLIAVFSEKVFIIFHSLSLYARSYLAV